MSKPHTIFLKGNQKNIPKGRAVPVRSRSSSGGNGNGSDE